MRKLAADLTENAQVFVETRRLLGEGRVLEVVENEAEQALELAPEFYSGSNETATSNGGQEGPNWPEGAIGRPASVEGADAHEVPWDMTAEEEPSTRSDTEEFSSATTPPWESEPESVPAVPTAAAGQGNERSAPPRGETATVADKSKAAAASAIATKVLRRIVGPLEPDATGNTVRRSDPGVEYVVFKISANGSTATVLCNRAGMLPEIARRQGSKGAVEVAVTGNNGHQYYVLERFLEGWGHQLHSSLIHHGNLPDLYRLSQSLVTPRFEL